MKIHFCPPVRLALASLGLSAQWSFTGEGHGFKVLKPQRLQGLLALLVLGLAITGPTGCGRGELSRPLKPAPPDGGKERKVASVTEWEIVQSGGARVPVPTGAPGILLTIPGMTVTSADTNAAGLAVQAIHGVSLARATAQFRQQLQIGGWRPSAERNSGNGQEMIFTKDDWAVWINSWEERGVTYTQMQMESQKKPASPR